MNYLYAYECFSETLKGKTMPINFNQNDDNRFFTATYTGVISNDDALVAWKNFLESDNWIPGSNALNDLSGACFDEVSIKGIKEIVELYLKVFETHKTKPSKIAIYAPDSLQYELAMIYGLIGLDTAENIGLFKDVVEAISWLIAKPADVY